MLGEVSMILTSGSLILNCYYASVNFKSDHLKSEIGYIDIVSKTANAKSQRLLLTYTPVNA